MLTWKDKFLNFLSRNYKKIIISLVFVVVGLLLVVAYSQGLLNNSHKNDSIVAKDVFCGNLSTVDNKNEGYTPFKPSLKAKVSGNFNSAADNCELFIDGRFMGKTKPNNGLCEFSSIELAATKTYKISYKLIGQKTTCENAVDIKVLSRLNLQPDTSGGKDTAGR